MSVHRPHCVLVSVVLCSWIIADCCWVSNFSSFECRHWFGQQACAGHWGRHRTPAAQQTAKHHKTSQSIAKPPSTKCVSYKYTFRPPCSTVALWYSSVHCTEQRFLISSQVQHQKAEKSCPRSTRCELFGLWCCISHMFLSLWISASPSAHNKAPDHTGSIAGCPAVCDMAILYSLTESGWFSELVLHFRLVQKQFDTSPC